ncbi:MAG: IS30 family transposase [Candidatus Hodarchaeales archaeon]
MSTYMQLTQEQRYQIKAFLSVGTKKPAIARELGVAKSTIYREVKRNAGQRGYRPKQAHGKALKRRKTKSQTRVSAETWALVEKRLRKDWSPEQISGRLKENGIYISHERIYQYVYADKRAGGNLWKHLRCPKKYRKRVGGRDRRGKIPNRRSIEERPAIVEERTCLGDWEGDLILGKNHQGVILTLTERKSRFTLLRSLSSKHADPVTQAIIELLKWIAHLKSITFDNGKEFAGHQEVSLSLNTDCYFAHPYASWERGTNENTNGLIRQYLPKSRNLKNVSVEEEIMIMDQLNLRPRKCLDFKTPYEVFFGYQFVALTS